MKRPIRFAWVYQITLLLSLVIIGGLVGAYGIHVRPETSQTKTGQLLKLEEVQNGDGGSFARKTKDADRDGRKVDSANSAISPPNPAICQHTFQIPGEWGKTHSEPQIRGEKYIDISLSAQSLSLFEDGKLLDSYPVSTGKSGMETPGGTHAIANKARRAWSRKYGVFLPYWMAITPSGMFGIHELPECPDGVKEGAEYLGLPVSHGCVRLGVGPAKRVYHWAEIGTLVVVH